MRSTFRPRRPGLLLALADAVAILAFATIGLISHRHGVGLRGYARDALPILAAWFAVAFALRTYVVQSLWRLVVTWLVGVTGGVIIRALALGRSLDGEQATFLIVSLVTIGVFVVVARWVVGRRLRVG